MSEQEQEYKNPLQEAAESMTPEQVALMLAENEKLRLQVKYLSIHLKAYEQKEEYIKAAQFAYEYFEQGIAQYGIGIRDGKIIYLDSGAELPLGGRSETPETSEPVMQAVEGIDEEQVDDKSAE